ncbi:MAG TPA: F0F1 ATP synthase subunit B [Gammaproteobacteria bacterium]|jgi:F-type H+-transporting ATPase subunit b|nr:F0F1 ATP synthase subunit B [Gammaproteobacteria bacterium]
MNINLTLIGQTITFFLFVWFCMKFVWPPLINALQERKEKIAEGLAAADRGKHEQELAEQRVVEKLKEAKAQASEILGKAERRASEIVEEAKTTAVEESDRIKVSAQADIDQEINRAKESLRKDVSGIALAGAEKILGREINADAHSAVLDDLVAQI